MVCAFDGDAIALMFFIITICVDNKVEVKKKIKCWRKCVWPEHTHKRRGQELSEYNNFIKKIRF